MNYFPHRDVYGFYVLRGRMPTDLIQDHCVEECRRYACRMSSVPALEMAAVAFFSKGLNFAQFIITSRS
jgi:hypothetical protein